MMIGCIERLIAILKDEDAPFWDKAEAEHYLKEHLYGSNPEWVIKYYLKWGVR